MSGCSYVFDARRRWQTEEDGEENAVGKLGKRVKEDVNFGGFMGGMLAAWFFVFSKMMIFA